jgi:hypothetical protein
MKHGQFSIHHQVSIIQHLGLLLMAHYCPNKLAHLQAIERGSAQPGAPSISSTVPVTKPLETRKTTASAISPFYYLFITLIS